MFYYFSFIISFQINVLLDPTMVHVDFALRSLILGQHPFHRYHCLEPIESVHLLFQAKKSLYLIVDKLIFICVRNAFIKIALISQTIFIYTILSLSLELSSVRKIGQQFQHFTCVDNYRRYKLGVFWFF